MHRPWTTSTILRAMRKWVDSCLEKASLVNFNAVSNKLSKLRARKRAFLEYVKILTVSVKPVKGSDIIQILSNRLFNLN